MIRLPFSTIELGTRDIDDFDKRQRRRKLTQEENERNGRVGQAGKRSQPAETPLSSDRLTFDDIPAGDGYTSRQELSDILDQYSAVSEFGPLISLPKNRAESELHLPDFADEESEQEDESTTKHEPGDQEGSAVDAHHENISVRRPSSPYKYDFHYGGFLESPSQQHEGQMRRSSPFAPDDVSTPPHLPNPAMQRGRSRLGRSPLIYAQNASSSSPERRPTSSLTPRVVSRVATHNTPGIIFAQPARRPPTQSRSSRAYRHQTNSFSFDDSERSIAAYEQERVSSDSSTNSRPRPLEDLSLHEELLGSSLQSSRSPSAATFVENQHQPNEQPHDRPIYYPPPNGDREGETSDISSPQEFPDSARIVYFSSPQLPLPPPFSVTPRSVSRADSLPNSLTEGYHFVEPATSPVRSLSGSPNRIEEAEASNIYSLSGNADERPASNPASGANRFVRAVERVFSGRRNRSPSTHPSPSPSTSPTPRQNRGRTATRNDSSPEASTLSTSYQVYNDSRPASSQPQTPAHLPEARHQSQYHPSYTAPMERTATSSWNLHDASGLGDGSPHVLRRSRRSRHRRGMRRPGSPTGLMEDGFRGLYGGRENGDEERNWLEGVEVRARNEEIRRQTRQQHAGRQERSLSQTPEREDRLHSA